MDLRKLLNSIREKTYKNFFNLKKSQRVYDPIEEEEPQQNSAFALIDQQVDKIRQNPQIEVPIDVLNLILQNNENVIYFQNQLINKTNIPNVSNYIIDLVNKMRSSTKTQPVSRLTIDPEYLQGQIDNLYSKYVPQEDPQLDIYAYNAIAQNMAEKERQKNPGIDELYLQEVINEKMKILGEDQSLLEYALGQPQFLTSLNDYAIDNRIAFFIHNPEYLREAFYKDPELASLVAYQLRKIGVGINNSPMIDDVIRGLGQVGELKGREHRNLVKILNNRAGEYLFNFLINGFMGEDSKLKEDLISWAEKKAYGFQQNKTRFQQRRIEPSSSEEREMDIWDVIPEQDKLTEEQTPEERENREQILADISGRTTAIAKEYIKDDFEGIENLREDTCQKYVDDLTQAYQNASSEREKNTILNRYNSAEQLNIFSIAALGQVDELLSTLGKPIKSKLANGQEAMLFKNEFGSFIIPFQLIESVLKDVGEKGKGDVSSFGQYVNNYREKLKEQGEEFPFEPKWGYMANCNFVAKNFVEMGRIKKDIRDLYKRTGNVNNLLNVINSQKELREKLDFFAGVNTKAFAETGRYDEYDAIKRNNFINMSLNQSEDYINYLLSLAPDPSKLTNPESQQQEYDRVENVCHSLRPALAAKFPPILGYMYKVKQEYPDLYTTNMMRAFYDFLSPDNRYRNYQRDGRRSNPVVEDKTNIELSNEIRGEKATQNLQTIETINVEQRGTPQYAEFFAYYEALEEIRKKQERMQSKVEQKQQERNSKKEDLNRRLEAIVDDFKNNKSYLVRLNQIIPDKEKVEIEDFIRKWGLLESIPEDILTPQLQKKIEKYKDRRYIEDFVKGWDRVSDVPDKIHYLFGTPTVKKLSTLDNELKLLEGGIQITPKTYNVLKNMVDSNELLGIDITNISYKDLENIKQSVWSKIRTIAEKGFAGKSYQLSKDIQASVDIMNILYSEYNRLKEKLYKMNSIKQNMVKFANNYVIAEMIDKEIDDFMILFSKVFN